MAEPDPTPAATTIRYLHEFRADVNHSFEGVNARIDSMEQQLRDLTGLVRSLQIAPKKRSRGRKGKKKRKQPVEIQQEDNIFSTLPGEILEHIFAYLPGSEFVRLRAVCGRWKEIIDGCPALMRRTRIIFPRDLSLDEDFELDFTLPVGGATFNGNPIMMVYSWWPLIGQELECLKLKGFYNSWLAITSLLRLTPKLKRLHLESEILFCQEDISVELLNLEELTVYNSLVTQRLFCPHLKRMECWAEGEFVADFLRAAKDTMEKLSVTLTFDVLDALVLLENLTELELRLQTGLEDYWYFLDRISEAMPKLKRLSISTLCESDGLARPLKISYLNKLIELEYFKACGSYPCIGMIDCADLSHLSLKEISFSNIYFFYNSLEQGFSQSPNIRHLTLKSCKFENGRDILIAINFLHRSLQYLEIESVPTIFAYDYFLEHFDSLRFLRLGFLDELKQFYLDLIQACPNVEVVQLNSLPTVDDDVVLFMCQTMKRLRYLALSECAVTDVSVSNIVNNCPALEKFMIDRFCKLTMSARHRLEFIDAHDYDLVSRFKTYVPGKTF